MSDEEVSNRHARPASEVFLITRDDGLYLDAVAPVDLSALAWNDDIPRIDSLKHATQVLESLLAATPHTLGCVYPLDDLQFAEMRSSVLQAGIAVLAVQAGHQAVIAPVSAKLPAANWRSEFIFRATRGIRLLKPELSEQDLLILVTREIQFFEEHRAGVTTPYRGKPPAISGKAFSAARF